MELSLGDMTLRYSELTMPYLQMQGVSARIRSGSLWVEGFTGKRPGNFWGKMVGENYFIDRDQGVDVSGARLHWLVNDEWDIGVTALGRSAPKENVLGSYSVQAGEFNYRKDRYHFVSELASSSRADRQAGAYRGELNYDAEKLGWQVAYRDVAPDYNSLSDYFSYTGMQGWSLYGRAVPFRAMSLSSSYENYRQRFSGTVTNPDHSVERLRVRMGLDRIIFFRPSVTYFSNYRDGFRSSGMNLNIHEIELLQRRLWAYYNFSTWKYSTPDVDYLNDRSLIGLTYRQGLLSLRTERVDEQFRYVSGGEPYGIAGWNVITTLGDFRWRSGVRMSMSYWYQNRKNTLNTLDQNRNSFRVSLGQGIGDLYWYLNGVVSMENSLLYEYQARNGYFYHNEITQSEISGGLVYRF